MKNTTCIKCGKEARTATYLPAGRACFSKASIVDVAGINKFIACGQPSSTPLMVKQEFLLCRCECGYAWASETLDNKPVAAYAAPPVVDRKDIRLIAYEDLATDLYTQLNMQEWGVAARCGGCGNHYTDGHAGGCGVDRVLKRARKELF